MKAALSMVNLIPVPALPSAHKLGDTVWVTVQGKKVVGKVFGITFMEGKVLYSVMVYTNTVHEPSKDKYGILNSIGYDELGREYIRIPNIDSTFVERYPNCK